MAVHGFECLDMAVNGCKQLERIWNGINGSNCLEMPGNDLTWLYIAVNGYKYL